MTSQNLQRVITEFLDGYTTMTLACCRSGVPWAAAVYYARRGFDLVFFSSRSSRHSTAFAENEAAAAEVHGIYDNWKDIRGLQMEGVVLAMTSPFAAAMALATYLNRYPFVREFLESPRLISKAVANKTASITLYVFRPSLIKYVDNQEGFGSKWTLKLEAGRPIHDVTSA